jgi:hypothetical protein
MSDIEERIKVAFEPYRFTTERVTRSGRSSPPGRQGPRRVSRLLLIAAAVALVVSVPLVLPGGGVGGADPAAAATLLKAAEAARAEPWFGSLQDGQYLKFKMIQSNPWLCAGRGDLTVEWWLRSDGSGKGVTTPGHSYALTPTTSMFDYWSSEDYPTDPGVLSERFASDPNFGIGVPAFMGTGNAATFDKVSALMSNFTLPPKLRAALFQVAASLNGVELIGPVTDPLGRPGTAVGYTYEGLRQQLIFDPATAKLLASEWVLVDPQVAAAAGRTGQGCGIFQDGPPGMVEDSMTFFSSAVVDSTNGS